MKFTILHLLVIVVVLSTGCGKMRYHVPSGSMEPTIPAGTDVIVDHRAFNSTDPALWDIVVFHEPDFAKHAHLLPSGTKPSQFVMRIVAMPGDEVDFGGERILIGGRELVLPSQLSHLSYVGLARLGIKPDLPSKRIKLKSDEYFVLGDNTTNSNDSRLWGPLRRSKITGKIMY